MGMVRVAAFGVSLDGFGAGVDQSLDNPLGVRGPELMSWFFPTRTFQKQFGKGEGTTGLDNDLAERAMAGNGAWILGRNMFGPVRGPWPDDSWKGWWGPNPPYHVPVFVLTHHARAPLAMEGGTTFHFVTDGIESALAQAKAAAGDQHVRIGGGASTIRQYLAKQLIDELHLVVSPVMIGCGEPLLAGLDMSALGYRVREHTHSDAAMHVFIERA